MIPSNVSAEQIADKVGRKCIVCGKDLGSSRKRRICSRKCINTFAQRRRTIKVKFLDKLFEEIPGLKERYLEFESQEYYRKYGVWI